MRRLDISPRIYMADSDFHAVSNGGQLCNEEGEIGSKEFCQIMLKEIR